MHFNLNYGSFAEALKYKDGIAVLAVLYHVSTLTMESLIVYTFSIFIFRELFVVKKIL